MIPKGRPTSAHRPNPLGRHAQLPARRRGARGSALSTHESATPHDPAMHAPARTPACAPVRDTRTARGRQRNTVLCQKEGCTCMTQVRQMLRAFATSCYPEMGRSPHISTVAAHRMRGRPRTSRRATRCPRAPARPARGCGSAAATPAAARPAAAHIPARPAPRTGRPARRCRCTAPAPQGRRVPFQAQSHRGRV